VIIWIKHKDINIDFYTREFENKNNWFTAFRIGINEYYLSNRLVANLHGHIWQQPKDFDFNTSDSFCGGAVDTELKYYFETKNIALIDGFSFDLGFIYKTKGFLPEEVNLKEYFG